jgi:hypothetical protein
VRHLGRNLPAALRCHLRRALDRLAPPDRHQLARGRPSAAEPGAPARRPARARAGRQETATLASAGIPKPQELLLGATESERRAGEDERDSGADQHRLVVILIASRQTVRESSFQIKSTLSLVDFLVFHSV